MENIVNLLRISQYDEAIIHDSLPDDVFGLVKPGDNVVIKPNWVLEAHKTKKDEWDYVITHPTVITAVLRKVLGKLNGVGRVAIMDGPTTESSFSKLISHYPVERWHAMASQAGIVLEVIDLRDQEWITENDIVVKRKELPGDPRGRSEFNLQGDSSEFWQHSKSTRGYYGADYDREETNRAHDGQSNVYRVSRTVAECDVFINLPKLKTHKKAGITCCLKNLVGINTYKNYLPHHSEGGPSDGGDQFPVDGLKARLEGPFAAFMKQNVLRHPLLARYLGPLIIVLRKVLGRSGEVVRSGNWHGNNTIWRMILDLNKVLFYGNPDGTTRPDAPENRKRYIGVVDAIRAGEGYGPLEPEPVEMHYLFCGTNPAAIDAVSATLMGFDFRRIPSITRAFDIRRYPFCPFQPEDIKIHCEGLQYRLTFIPDKLIVPFDAPLGWKGHVEKSTLDHKA
jgi:uncharacterized protein (DUF362 family)